MKELQNTYYYYRLLYTTVSRLTCVPVADAGQDFYISSEDRYSENPIPIYNSTGDVIGFSDILDDINVVLNEHEKPQKFVLKNDSFKKYEELNVSITNISNISGGKVNYYKVDIKTPLNEDLVPYTAEFEDIALALGLNPMEYNIMKDLWRNANARTNGNGKEGNTQLRTYQKAAHYSNLLLKLEDKSNAN